ncbi:MAG: 3-hydroxyacyl-CoA dehydrogenase [Alphaproteobacteria bacterium]|nr:3-hydroxyacyl-CoA dehydrogenase [Alphaproteobacteria bacterium]
MTDNDAAAVQLSIEDGVAVITVNNPPVNAISQAVRQGLVDAMKIVTTDAAIKAAVIRGAGKVFIAGADVREFGKPPMEPFLPEVVTTIEATDKPVAAAIHGVALGGGFEIALGCHCRVMSPNARVGFPEVNLGIIPGAGGTQRLPRLCGVEKAADLVTSGRQVGAKEAMEAGLIDVIAESEDDLLSAAKRLALSKVKSPLRRISEMSVPAPAAADFFTTEKAKITRAARGQHSPVRALEAVEAAATLPFAEGMKRERAIFQELRASDQAKALRHVFFGERAVSKVPGLENARPRKLDKLAVIGGGTMGAGIAVACLRAGFPVVMIEADAAALDRGKGNVDKNLEGFVSRGRLTADAKDEHLGRLALSLDYGALKDADLVIEAVFEDMEVKKTVFGKLDAAMKPGAVLATNTSYLDINAIAAATTRPGDVIGLHFFSPAFVMRLLEIVRPARTSDDVVATGFELAKKLGKVGVLSGVCDGFIGNRILAKTRKQADYMIEDGALPWDVDKAMEAFGMPMGPFRVMDLAGLDIAWAQRKRTVATRDPKERYVEIADRICEQGWFGQKTGRGWYVYEAGKPVPNPEVEKIILAESARKGIARRTIPAQEIQDRILYAMINEGARIVDEGIAARPLDVDMVKVFGYGFPRWRGGPLCTVDIIGLPKVLDGIRAFARDDPLFWKPSALLERLVAEGKTFADLNT